MSALEKKEKYKLEEYLSLEQEINERFEFYFGEVYNLAGGTIRHNRISLQMVSSLEKSLKNRKCNIFAGDVKLELIPNQYYVYPDVMLTCDDNDLENDQDTTIKNPSIIVEVLSSSTESYDKSTKADAYRKISSLRYYILIAQDKILIDVYERKNDFWKLTNYENIEQIIKLEQLDIDVKLSEIYKDIKL